ncbi:glycosyltransferase [Pseudonocardia spirodelae]|uniref:Glycosyltransferase n=1 Tax=Pseudonocardia spirodelae TaxID=3133431 RepID=A0ABU8T2S0_9PSEU
MSARIALVHERFTEIAGSEHVVEQLAREWPDAPVHVPVSRPAGVPPGLEGRLHTSGVDHLYRLTGGRTYAPLTPLFPRAFRRMRLDPADAVVISHHAFATQAAFATAAPTVAYVHSPARWAWETGMRAGEASGRLGSAALDALARITRRAELAAAPRLTRIVANSHEVARRVRAWWGRDAEVVHPPVDTEAFTPDPGTDREDFFLLAGRLVPYKRPEIAIEAAREAGVRLVVVGEGRGEQACRRVAGPDVRFLGRVPHRELLALHRRARAVLMPGVEDFGIVPVEAMACATPVVALGQGGALDSIAPGVTGVLVPPGDDESVVAGFAEALRGFDPGAFDPAAVRRHAESFSRAQFRSRMRRIVDDTAGV